jgi:hypothetical protein
MSRSNRTRAGRSPEQQAAEAGGRRDEGPKGASSPEAPTLPALAPGSGTTLSCRLSPREPAGCAVVGSLFLLLLCSGVLTPLAIYLARALPGGRLQGVAFTHGTITAGIVALILGGMWLALFVGLVKHLLLWRLGQPVVEIAPHPLHPGEKYQLFLSQPGPLRLTAVSVTLVCEEEATYVQGTDTRKETCLVYSEKLAEHEALLIERDYPWEVRHQSRVPDGAMHSFNAEHNKVSWMVRVEGQAPLRPRFRHDFPLVVCPPRQREGRA